jgi:hypothetical protein
MLKRKQIDSNWAPSMMRQGRGRVHVQRQRSAANGRQTGQRISRGACDAPAEGKHGKLR